jgi:hypothetical protein
MAGSVAMRTISASELERRGIGAWDEILKDGAVHVTKGDKPCYVIIDEDLYRELVEGYGEAEQARIQDALDDMKAGRVREVTADRLIAEAELDD